MSTRMQQRRGLSSEWSTANPVLADGELGVTTDTDVIKLGDGMTAWNDLPTVFASRYLPILGKATDSELLDGYSHENFVKTAESGSYVEESDIATMGRDRGTGNIWPTLDNRRGDHYYHTSVAQLGVYNGTGWRLIGPGRVATIAARDAVPWYAGMQVFVTADGQTYEYQNSFLGWTRPWGVPWGELTWFTIAISQGATGSWVDYGAATLSIPKGRKLRMRGASHWYTASTTQITVNTRVVIMRDANATPTTVVYTGADHDRRVGGAAGDLADFTYDIPYNVIGTLGYANMRFSVQAKTFGAPNSSLYPAGTAEHNFLTIEDMGPWGAVPTA